MKNIFWNRLWFNLNTSAWNFDINKRHWSHAIHFCYCKRTRTEYWIIPCLFVFSVCSLSEIIYYKMFRTPSTTPFKERLEARRSCSESLILRRQKIPNDKSYLLIFLAKTRRSIPAPPQHASFYTTSGRHHDGRRVVKSMGRWSSDSFHRCLV